MTLLNDAVYEKRFDRRVVEKNLSRGFAKAEDYEKFLKELPDEAENADWVSTETLDEE